MNKQEYNNVIETTVAQQTGEKDALQITREVLSNMGVVLPQGDLKQVSEGLATDDYMGWRKCTVKEAQEYANAGTAVVAVSDEQIAVVAANDEEGEVVSTSSSVMALDENTSALAVVDTAFYANSRAGTTQFTSRYGQVLYKGIWYDIHVPNYLGNEDQSNWNTKATVVIDKMKFDPFKFLFGFDIPDVDQTGLRAVGTFDNHTNSVVIPEELKGPIVWMNFATGLLNAFSVSVGDVFVRFCFQENSTGQRRVIIVAGSSDAKDLFDEYATGVINSMYNNRKPGVSQGSLSASVSYLYEEITGEEAPHATYDCQITVDERHKNDNGGVSFLWLSAYGDLMETPIVYPQDKVEFGRFKSVLKWGIEPFASVDLSQSYKATQENCELFLQYNG